MQTESTLFALGMLTAGLAAAFILHSVQLKKCGLSIRTALWTASLGTVLAIIGAKAGYLLHNLGGDLWEGNFEEVFSLQAEKLSFAGGCAGFAAAAVLAGKISGIRPARALDLFTAPGCVMICLARFAEGGMGSIGLGNMVETEWLRFFPAALEDSWGDAYLAVFILEALTALICLFCAFRWQRDRGSRYGVVFEKTAVCLIGAQMGWEMLLQYPYVRTFLISFISLDQVIFAVMLMGIVIHRCVKSGRKSPGIVTAILLGISAFVQFFRDKPYLFTRYLPEEAEIWLQDHMEILSLTAFALISAGIILTGLRASTLPDKTKK